MNKTGKRILLYLSMSFAFITSYSAASELVILRGDEDYPPDEMHINGELTGFHIELIKNAASLISLPIRFESIPWKRAVQMLENGKGDALTYVSKNADRERYALFLNDNILSESHYHLVINSHRKNEIQYDGNIKGLIQYTIGVQRGYVYSEEINQSTFDNKIIFNTVDQMISLLSANRVDFAILTMAEYQAQKDTNNFKNITILSPELTSSASYIAFSKAKNTHKTAELFAKAMKDYKASEEYLALRLKYNK